MMKNFKQKIAGALVLTITATTIGTGAIPVQAAEEVHKSASIYKMNTVNYKAEKFDEAYLKQLGFSDSEIEKMNNAQPSDLYVKDGMIIDENGKERGKWSAAVKIIKAGLKKLPKAVQKYLDDFGLGDFLGFIDTATGALSDVIYDACKYVGMSDTVANIVTTAITTILF